jgi:hypothetical protein
MSPSAPTLSRLERGTLVLLLALILGATALGEYRHAFASRRMGDAGVYLRTAWAMRSGADPYTVTDDNNWHYIYPPPFAILLTPLADPPLGADRTGYLPFAVSIGIYLTLNLLLLSIAVHWLASALEASSEHEGVRRQPTGCRRWWLLRLLPLAVCLPPLIQTLERGQSNFYLLLALCGLVACLIRGRRLAAGLCLAGAVCLKIIPAYLLLVPLWRRDARCLAGCGLGLVLGLVALPLVAIGPAATAACYRSLQRQLIAPGLGEGHDDTLAKELTNVTATDTQSFVAVITNVLNPDPATRPDKASLPVRASHWLLSGTFTLLTLLSAWRRGARDPAETAIFVGALALIMLLTSPICHLHYFVLAVPLLMGLLVRQWERLPDGQVPSGRLGLGTGLGAVLAVFLIGQGIPHLVPLFQAARDFGLATGVTLALWATGCLALRWPLAGPVVAPGAVARQAA